MYFRFVIFVKPECFRTIPLIQNLFILSKKLNKQEKISSEVDKLLELTTASEEKLANLPSDSLDDMLSSLQVSNLEHLDLFAFKVEFTHNNYKPFAITDNSDQFATTRERY